MIFLVSDIKIIKDLYSVAYHFLGLDLLTFLPYLT